jgi:hypothetical protein
MKIYKLSQYKKTYVGDCTHILETDFFGENFDATMLQQLIDTSTPIALEDAINQCNVIYPDPITMGKKPLRFEAAINKDILWIYDKSTDIHYFYE